MDWMVTLGYFWLKLLGAMAALTVVFAVLGRLMPCNPGMFWWKDLRGAATDFVYWFLVPLFLRVARTLLLIAGVALLFGGREPQPLPLRGLPLWLQCLAILVLQDVLLYALHRLFHSRAGWKFHAVHHSPKLLDWTATVRFHPVNHLLSFHLADVAVLLLGFSPEALLLMAPFNIAYSAMVHANLNWTFGPLKYVFASPVFHRWHHTTQEEGLNTNFASTFPFLDVMFGSFYMPADRLPERFGNGEPDFPEGFWGQVLYPFLVRAGAEGRLNRRRIAVATACVLTVVGLVGGACYVMARLESQNEELTRALALAEEARQALQIDRARQAWAENDLVRASIMLEAAAEASPQSAEAEQLRGLCRRKCLVFTGHEGAVLATAVSGDGRRVISAGEDRTVRVWDAETGQEALALKGHSGTVHGVAVSADGRWIVSASFDKTVKIWDGETGQEKLTLTGHSGPVLSVAVSGDGRRVVSGGVDLTARVWDGATGREECTLTGHLGAVSSVAISGDGCRVVSASGMTAKLWDAATGEEVATLKGHQDLVYGVAFSPDGKHVVSASFDDRIKQWDAATGREELSLRGHVGPVYSVALSSDNCLLVSGGKDGTVRVWNTVVGREALTLKGHTESVTAVAISGDGRRVVSASRDGTVKVWDVQQCQQSAADVGQAFQPDRQPGKADLRPH